MALMGRVGRTLALAWAVIAIAGLGCSGPKAAPQDAAPQDAGAMDTAAPSDAFTAAMIPAGGHSCRITNTGNAIWTQGWETVCTVTAADNPPLTAAQKQAADAACTFYLGAMVVADCPPRENVIAFCPVGAAAGGAGTKTWDLIYKSSVTPDVEALAMGAGRGCPYTYDLNGREIPKYRCMGSAAALVNGVMKTFNVNVNCGYKSDGTRSRYTFNGDTISSDRLGLLVLKTGALVTLDTTDPFGATAAFYLGADGGGGFANSQMRITATTFLDRGAGLVATFTLGTSDTAQGGAPATVTDGMIDIRVGPAP